MSLGIDNYVGILYRYYEVGLLMSSKRFCPKKIWNIFSEINNYLIVCYIYV